jgi:AAA family ATP:ADP antiporter
MNQTYRKKETTKKETSLVFIYCLMAILAGLFLATFDLIVHARFLELLGYKYLAASYVISGGLGVVITYLYSLFFRRIHTKTLSFILYTFNLLAVGFYFVLLLFLPSKPAVFLGMVLLFPINILTLLPFNRFGRKMLSPRQSREISPKIKFWLWFGTGLGGALMTGSLYYFYSFDFITWLSFAVLVVFYLLQFILNSVHKKSNRFISGKEAFVPVSKSLFLFFTSKYARSVFLFGLLSSIVAFSIHFTFINIAAAGFQNVIGLSKFYGLFTAVLMVFIFGIDRFLIKRILYSYDSPYSLVLIPFGILIALALSIGGYFFFSSFQPHEHFTMFFLLVVITKVGIDSLRQIVQAPSLRTLFQTLDIRYKQVVYPRIEGTSVLLGLLISGGVILGLTFLKGFTLPVVLFWTAAVSIAWLITAILLVKQYQKEQSKSLERLRYRKAQQTNAQGFETGLWKALTGNNIIKIRHLLDTLSKTQPMVYEDLLERLLAHPNSKVRKVVFKRIFKERINGLIPELRRKANESNPEEKEILFQVIEDLRGQLKVEKSTDELKEIIYSGDTNERIWLAYSINGNCGAEREQILFELVKDIEPEVQEAALKSLARLDKVSFSYSLLDFIYPAKYNPYALYIIAKSGSEAIDYLEREQLVHNTTDIVHARIIKLYGEIGTERSLNNIISDIENQDRYVLLHSLQALIDINYQSNAQNKYKLLNLVIKQIGIITQNLNYYHVLHKKRKLSQLTESFRQEIDYNYDILFKFLSLVYNKHIISSIRNLLMEGSHSQINHGIELVDEYFDQDIKPVFLPLVEDISLKERLKKLDYYFVQPRITTKEILRNTLTYDFKTLSLFPRACAMMHIYQNLLTDYQQELVFNAYHKEPLLSETAVFILNKMHPDALQDILNNEKYDTKLLKRIHDVENQEEKNLFYNRFVALKEYELFNSISEYVALQLAHSARKVSFEKNTTLVLSELADTDTFMLTNQQALLAEKNYVISCFKNLVNINLLIDYGVSEVIADTHMEIWLFPKQVVNELLYDHVDFANLYFSVIEKVEVRSNT